MPDSSKFHLNRPVQYTEWEESLPLGILGNANRRRRRLYHISFYLSRPETKHAFGKSYVADYDIVNYLRFVGRSMTPIHLCRIPPELRSQT